jgi:Holliday junction resolvase-like predicted endonuclease
MATSVELREMAHEVYARAQASLDPSIKQQLLRLADDYLKQADELRRADVIQAAFPKPDRNIG